ncbi:MAG: hypothetical protein AUJ07_06705 [Crenarchaeota archaeon 13_1_40CM_3_53_5]|nr:MAG: hypothetical protein AUJ07_06705 [Crenarchaeota archaeon 13_1_40CM_3_53_5]
MQLFSKLGPGIGESSVRSLKDIPCNLPVNMHRGRKCTCLNLPVGKPVVFSMNLFATSQNILPVKEGRLVLAKKGSD